jgi:hypothetical protein
MSSAGATNLNRILRITAQLLFEKGEDVPAVANLLQGFVNPRMVRSWYERYCEVHGLPKSANSRKNHRRMPMPPIDFNAIKIQELNDMLDPPSGKGSTESFRPER